MSVVPDSSLREQLEAALLYSPGRFHSNPDLAAQGDVEAIMPILEAWEAAARADEREAAQAIADLIGAIHDQGCDAAKYEGCLSCQILRVIESDPRLKAWQALTVARSVGAEPKEQQT